MGQKLSGPTARTQSGSVPAGGVGTGTGPRSGLGSADGASGSGAARQGGVEVRASRRGGVEVRVAGQGGTGPNSLSTNLLHGFKCPVCSKFIVSDEMELHLVMCLTKPRVTYNEDVLCKEAGECAICLEELHGGDVIARLPCLCVYHKNCIDEWFEVNRCCPEHPSD